MSTVELSAVFLDKGLKVNGGGDLETHSSVSQSRALARHLRPNLIQQLTGRY